LHLINSERNYNNGQFAQDDYNVYRAVLSEVARPNLEMRQFSVRLTNGYGIFEYWTFDRINVIVTVKKPNPPTNLRIN